MLVPFSGRLSALLSHENRSIEVQDHKKGLLLLTIVGISLMSRIGIRFFKNSAQVSLQPLPLGD